MKAVKVACLPATDGVLRAWAFQDSKSDNTAPLHILDIELA